MYKIYMNLIDVIIYFYYSNEFYTLPVSLWRRYAGRGAAGRKQGTLALTSSATVLKAFALVPPLPVTTANQPEKYGNFHYSSLSATRILSTIRQNIYNMSLERSDFFYYQ